MDIFFFFPSLQNIDSANSKLEHIISNDHPSIKKDFVDNSNHVRQKLHTINYLIHDIMSIIERKTVQFVCLLLSKHDDRKSLHMSVTVTLCHADNWLYFSS